MTRNNRNGCSSLAAMVEVMVIFLLVWERSSHLPKCQAFSIPSRYHSDKLNWVVSAKGTRARTTTTTTTTTSKLFSTGTGNTPSKKRSMIPPPMTTLHTSISSTTTSMHNSKHNHNHINTNAVEDDLMVLSSTTMSSSMDLPLLSSKERMSDYTDEYDNDMEDLSISTIFNQQVQTSSIPTSSLNLNMARGLILLAAAIYGSNFCVVKVLNEVMPMCWSATLRFTLAVVVVGWVVLKQEEEQHQQQATKRNTDKYNDDNSMVLSATTTTTTITNEQEQEERNRALCAGMEIGFWYCLGYFAQAEGLQTVAAGKSAFFNALAVVIVPLLDVMLKGRKLELKQVLSVLVACAGVGLLELGPSSSSSSTGGLTLDVSIGDWLSFSQAVFFGIGYWRLESASQSNPGHPGRLTVGQLVAIAIGSCAYTMVAELSGLWGQDPLSTTTFSSLSLQVLLQLQHWLSDPFIVGALLWTGLVSTALALYLETVALKVVSASELTLLMTTISLWAASYAYFGLGEVLSMSGMVGGSMIMAGCMLGNWNFETKNAENVDSSKALQERIILQDDSESTSRTLPSFVEE